MAAQPSVEDSFTFVGGLNTEGAFFLTPKNSWKEGDNVTPNTDGSIERRPGLNYETNYTFNYSGATAAHVASWAYTAELWTAVGGNGNIDFLVVQEGPFVHFYRAATNEVSANKIDMVVDLRLWQCFGNDNVVGNNVITVASAYGRLVITSVDTDPILCTYNETTGALTVERLNLAIRDFNGIPSPVRDVDEKTQAEWTTANFWPEALYNLYNQGWTNARLNDYKAAKANKLPSNTKQWVYGKDIDDVFDVDLLDKQDFGSSPAPRGRFIINAFYQDRASALENIDDTDVLDPTVPTTPNVNDTLVQFVSPGGGDGSE